MIETMVADSMATSGEAVFSGVVKTSKKQRKRGQEDQARLP